MRTYPPGSKEFTLLYGQRNDTEARHADIKSRIKHLPRDAARQELRLLGAAIASNTLSLHAHLQAHGRPNVFDDTA